MTNISYEEIAEGCEVKPLRDFVVLEKTEKKQTGLIVRVEIDPRTLTGRCIARGCGVLTQNGEQHPIEINLGDEVVFDKQSAVQVEHKGKTYFITNELSCRAVLL